MLAIQIMHSRGAATRRTFGLKVLAAVFGLALIAGAGTKMPAAAQDAAQLATRPPLEVAVDEAQVVRLNRQPTSVVVGNPLIADAAMEQNGVVFLVGKNYGTTNLIALDEGGQEIANYDIVVRTGGHRAISLYRGSERVSLNCAPRCETELDVGDGPAHYEIIRTQVENKTALSEAQASGGR